MDTNVIKEKSCGLIIFKKELEELKVLLVHQVEGHWSLPKGHVEDGETEEETAIRETFEETGVRAKVVSNFREVITYYVRDNILKDVELKNLFDCKRRLVLLFLCLILFSNCFFFDMYVY